LGWEGIIGLLGSWISCLLGIDEGKEKGGKFRGMIEISSDRTRRDGIGSDGMGRDRQQISMADEGDVEFVSVCMRRVVLICTCATNAAACSEIRTLNRSLNRYLGVCTQSFLFYSLACLALNIETLSS
jgi:hypothetical protein